MLKGEKSASWQWEWHRQRPCGSHGRYPFEKLEVTVKGLCHKVGWGIDTEAVTGPDHNARPLKGSRWEFGEVVPYCWVGKCCSLLLGKERWGWGRRHMLGTTWKAPVLVQGQMVMWATVSIVMDRSKEIQHMEGRWGGFVSGLSGLEGGVFLDGDTQERSLAWIWMCGLGRLWSQPDVWSLKLGCGGAGRCWAWTEPVAM